MPRWLQDLIALGVLIVIAPLIAWAARRHGRSIRGNLMMASILLGFGHAVDPPPEQKVESAQPGKDGPQPGEPPELDADR